MSLRRLNTFGCAAIIAANLVFVSCAMAAEGKCDLGKLGEVPIAMEGLRPFLTAQVNGKDAKFLLDSGATYSLMSTAEAEDLLKLQPKNIRALYGRGVARIHLNKQKEGEADIDAAVKLSPKAKEFYQAHGIGP
jgi:hypothetical protein